MSVDNTTRAKDFTDFVKKIETFCAFIEGDHSGNYRKFLEAIQKQLIELYSHGQIMPEFDLPENENIEEFDITDKDIKDVLSFIGDRLHDPFYWVVFDPADHEDTASVCGDLIDDLGDIYKDLKTFLIGFKDKDDDVKQNA